MNDYTDPVTGWYVSEEEGTTGAGVSYLEVSIRNPATGAVYRRSYLVGSDRPTSVSEWVDRIRKKEAEWKITAATQPSPKRHPNPTIRRCQRVLAMVHELHKMGFQRLRIEPGVSPSGGSWRCAVAPASNFLTDHGARLRDFGPFVAHYTSSMEAEYFGWGDASRDTARELAQKFTHRFEDVVERAIGQDCSYVGWYVEMLGHAERGALPIAYSDWYVQPDPRYLPTDGGLDIRLPMPPGGETEAYEGGPT